MLDPYSLIIIMLEDSSAIAVATFVGFVLLPQSTRPLHILTAAQYVIIL